MIDKVQSLYHMGFAIHLLKPRSKQPLESGWTTGPRKTWEQIKKAYRPGMNVGVRLGEASKVGDGYLACIDVDVKDPAFNMEAHAHLAQIVGDWSCFPRVSSGRGNGSCHLYFLSREPFKMVELRKHPKWEIVAYSTGRQMVLPPSIHPDTKKPYRWDQGAEPKPELKIPFIDVSSLAPREKPDAPASTSQGKFKPVPVLLFCTGLKTETVDAIIHGAGVSDRSAALLGVTNKMLKAGFTDNEVLSVLTDKENALGQVAYQHAQTNDRARAAEWVRKYTLEKSKRETKAQYAFEEECEEVELTEHAAAEQFAALVPEPDWSDKIERSGREGNGAPKNTLKNVIMILKGEAGNEIFKRDEFAGAELYSKKAPWGGKPGQEVGDIDTVLIKEWLANTYRFEPSDDRINQGISAVAHSNKYHPVRDYLDGLEWDGVPRIDNWLKTYLGAKAVEPYLSAVSRKVLIAMVKRIYEPGCKFDEILILQGVQGVGKSTLLRNLAGDHWFTDASIDVKDKDAVMTMRSIWLVELGELAVMNQADAEQLKQFASRTTDRIRVPYGRRTENFPRQCVFIGTTNRDEYLKDPTGDRRFWPVKVGKCDFKAVKRDRDQLFAEARFAYELGEPTYLEDEAMVQGAKQEQQARAMSDVWEDRLRDWLDLPQADEDLTARVSRERFRLTDLFEDGGPLAGTRDGLSEQRRAGDALRRLGFQAKSFRNAKGRVERLWTRTAVVTDVTPTK